MPYIDVYIYVLSAEMGYIIEVSGMVIAVVKRRSLLAVLAVAVAVVIVTVAGVGGSAAVAVRKNSKRLPVYSVETAENVVALSFDAAWGAEKTDRLIEILQREEAKATFFLVGMWVEKHPDKLEKIHESGYEIGTHSNTHPDMTKIAANKVKLELETSSKLIEDTIGVRPKFFRPPFGAYNDTLINTAEELGLMTIQWDVDSLDWKNYTAEQIAVRVLKGVKNGSIVLMHNDGENTARALELILAGLKNKGFKTVGMSELVMTENYTIDHTGRQIKING